MLRWIPRALLSFGVLATASMPGPAAAQTTGPCKGTIGGVDANRLSDPDRALEVDQLSPLPIIGRSSRPITSHQTELELAGFTWPLSRMRDKGNAFIGFIQFQESTRYTSGIFKVRGRGYGPGACVVEGFVKLVGREPLTTFAGMAGAGATILGLFALLALAFVSPGRQKDALREHVWAEGRARWRPRIAFLPVAAGLLLAGGITVLLQQYSLVYPTRLFTVVVGLAGLLVGVVIASLIRLLAVHWANRTATEE